MKKLLCILLSSLLLLSCAVLFPAAEETNGPDWVITEICPDQQDIQFAYIADWMGKHLTPDTPAVLTGDFNTEDFTAFDPVKSLGYALVNDTAHEFKTFRHNPVAIDNIVYREGRMTPEAFGMVDSDASDHNLLWCRFTLR